MLAVIDIYQKLRARLEAGGLGLVRDANSYNYTITDGTVSKPFELTLPKDHPIKRQRRILQDLEGKLCVYITEQALQKLRRHLHAR